MKNTPKIPVSSSAGEAKTLPKDHPPEWKEGPNAPVGNCPTCGITLYRVMGYYCGRDACPVFGRSGTLKPFMC